MKGSREHERKIITEIIGEKNVISDALLEKGYIEIEDSEYNRNYPYIKVLFSAIYKKNEQYYGLLGYEHFDGFIYDATLVLGGNFAELENFVRKEETNELESSLRGEVLTLGQLDSEMSSLLGDDCDSIYGYSRDEIFRNRKKGKVGDIGTFSWGNCDIWFRVIKEAEDMEDIVVKLELIEG